MDRLLSRLPRYSQYRAALDNDEEYARLVAALGEDEPQVIPPPPLAGYSEAVKRMDDVFDAVNAVNETLLAIYSKKKSKPRPTRASRPETAHQRLKRLQKTKRIDSMVEHMTGGR